MLLPLETVTSLTLTGLTALANFFAAEILLAHAIDLLQIRSACRLHGDRVPNWLTQTDMHTCLNTFTRKKDMASALEPFALVPSTRCREG